jgi:tetratricopeptide (TPR) repeat protein
MYADNGQFDSAAKYVDIGVERAGDDPAHDQRKRQALGDLIRAHEAAAFESPAVETLLQARLRRDSLDRALAVDERRLADLVAEWSGKNLRPETRAAVQRDSTMLAQRTAAARQLQTDLASTIERDSTAARDAFDGAIDAYERYLEEYPEDTEIALRLLRRYSLLGTTDGMDRMIDELARADSLDLGEITQAGNAVFNDGHAERAIELLDLAVERNPYMQAPLSTLARSYYHLEDAEGLRMAVERLIEIDPLNPQTMRLMAAAWDLAGIPDSVVKYVALADTGLGLGVTVTQFIPSPVASTVNGSILNMSSGPSEPATIEFEFLDTEGAVLGTVTVEVPALEPKRRHAFTAEADVPRAAAWRYRLLGGA